MEFHPDNFSLDVTDCLAHLPLAIEYAVADRKIRAWCAEGEWLHLFWSDSEPDTNPLPNLQASSAIELVLDWFRDAPQSRDLTEPDGSAATGFHLVAGDAAYDDGDTVSPYEILRVRRVTAYYAK